MIWIMKKFNIYIKMNVYTTYCNLEIEENYKVYNTYCY